MPTRITVPIVLVLTLVCTSVWASTSRSDVTAAMVYRVTKFVNWPTQAFDPPSSVFHICFDEATPEFRKLSEAALQPRRGRDVRVSASIGETCHVAVVRETIPDNIRDTGALIIGLDYKVYDSGAHVLLRFHRGRMLFSVNLTAAEQSRMAFSSEFLSLAREVR